MASIELSVYAGYPLRASPSHIFDLPFHWSDIDTRPYFLPTVITVRDEKCPIFHPYTNSVTNSKNDEQEVGDPVLDYSSFDFSMGFSFHLMR